MRKRIEYTVTDEGRDKGKVFIITELPASQAERWAFRALLLLQNSGMEISDDVVRSGMAGIVGVGLHELGRLRFEDVQPLLDEMFACVQIIPDPSMKNVVRPLVEDDIEEIATRLKLRGEVLSLHTGFSLPGAPSKSEPSKENRDSSTTPT